MDIDEATKEARKIIFSFSDPLIVYHYDADGISAGAIVKKAFLKKGKKARMQWIKKINEENIDELRKEKEIVFIDLGNSELVDDLKDVYIIDHHQIRTKKPQINPLMFGIDGGKELSGAGMAALVFEDSYELGVIGALGDMQYPFVGKNREILRRAIDSGKIEKEIDIIFYGRNSYPLVQFLAYNDQPYIPGISYNEKNIINLLEKLGIQLKEGEKWRKWTDLYLDEKKRIVSRLVKILSSFRMDYHIIGEVYNLKEEPKESPFYDTKQFATILNACGRHGKADLGIEVCFGKKRAEAFKMLELHRKMIKEGIEYAKNNLIDMGPFLLLDGRKVIDEGIIGIVAGMSLRQFKKPIIAISETEKELKLSARTKTHHNLSDIMNKAALSVGGYGGGHEKAAGATIPKDKLGDFLLNVGELLWK